LHHQQDCLALLVQLRSLNVEKWYPCGSQLLSLCFSNTYLSSRCEARDLHLPSTVILFSDVMKRLASKEGKFFVII
jgi:hypothetical protein